MMDVTTAVVIIVVTITISWTVIYSVTKWAEVREKEAEHK